MDGDARVELLIDVIRDALSRRYSVRCGREDVVDLDSTTDRKFSRHLVFHIPGCFFADNRHAGQFLRELLAELREVRLRRRRCGGGSGGPPAT